MVSRSSAAPSESPPSLDYGEGAIDALADDASGARVIDLVSLEPAPAGRAQPRASVQGMLRLAITLLVVGGCAAYLQAEKQVQVVDGAGGRQIETFAPNVGEVLERAGIQLGSSDRVEPDLQAPVPAGGEVQVMRAKNVVVEINGERTEHTVTGSTVDDVLEEISVVAQGTLIYPPPQTPVRAGDEIVVAETAEATMLHDGQTRQVTTNVRTAGGLLRQLGVVLGPHDRVEPSIVAYPSEGSTIRVVRVEKAVETIQSRIDFARQATPSDEVELGMREIQQAGQPGIREASYQILYEDGKVASRTLIASEVLRRPVPEVALVGTNRPTLLSASEQQVGKASWYSMPGLMAAHKSLPFGTLVKVTNLDNGRSVTVTVRDRGPYVDGRIIDLSDTAFAQLAPIGRGVVNVRIEW